MILKTFKKNKIKTKKKYKKNMIIITNFLTKIYLYYSCFYLTYE